MNSIRMLCFMTSTASILMLSNSVEAQNTGNLTTEGDCSPIVIESGDLTLNCPGIPPRFEELIGSVRRGMYMDWFVERFGEPRFAFCDHAIYSDKGIAIVIQADENDIRTGSVSAFALTTLEDFNIHGALDPDARYNSFGAKNFPNESFSDLYSWYVKEEKIPCVFGSLFMDSRLGRRTDLYMQCSQYGGGVENRDRNMPSEVKFLFHSDEKDYEDHFRGLGVSMVTKIADSRFDGRITFPFSTTIGNVDFHREFLRQQENGGARDFLEVFGSLAPNHVDVGSMICNNG